jgi:hypothetical protein
MAAALVVLVAGCRPDLSIGNVNAPDIERVYGSASSIEQAIGSQFQACHNSRSSVWNQMAQLALDGFTAGVGVELPRTAIVNLDGTGTYNDYAGFGTNGRIAANLVTALDRLVARGGTLGSNAQNQRGRAFGFFAIGCDLGWLAAVFDSAAIVTPGISTDSVPALSGAADVMRAALAMLDSAIAVASDPAASTSGGFPLPAAWVNGNPLNAADFIRLVRSFRARFQAGVARTPTERASVNWAAVIDDARNGVTADVMVNAGGSTNWINGRSSGVGGNSLPPLYYGMADVSRAYDAWLALPPSQRGPFLIVTPDRRWPQGATLAAQQASGASAGSSFSATPYFFNRGDPTGFAPTWLATSYVFRRLQYVATTASAGPVPIVTKAELDLLAAEGYLRAGNVGEAARLIDVTRVGRGQLPALSGAVTTATQPVPGGENCVPRVPAPPTFTSTTCGTIWEAMKWEKRMETAVASYGGWFTDSRGWDDLVEGTALEFPVPFRELASRQKGVYSYGGPLGSSAPRGTYGF